ncbi:MAG: hypothetical protein ACI4MJ_09190, partial [Aristaeellaceae bacterium]
RGETPAQVWAAAQRNTFKQHKRKRESVSFQRRRRSPSALETACSHPFERTALSHSAAVTVFPKGNAYIPPNQTPESLHRFSGVCMFWKLGEDVGVAPMQSVEQAVSNADELRRLLGNLRLFPSLLCCVGVLRWAAAQTCAGVSPLHPTRGIAP